MAVTVASTAHAKWKEAWEVEEHQAPLLLDKATLAGETAEDLLAIETQQHHRDEA
ncbi:hypothetical protein [Janthinobacterium lividum]|uniref:hypothetical protein n=1 Tax=Janthinobacterium lividum TaxID=29581 RepID=UPI00140D3A2A|nr:hypothetical protein [Janthinobacterium lividum]